jgi:hypothetical protein
MMEINTVAQFRIWSGIVSLLGIFLYLPVGVQLRMQPPTGNSSYQFPDEKDDSAKPLEQATRDFRKLCVRCHGDDFSGGPWREHGREIPDFTDGSWQKSRSNMQLLLSIQDGQGSRMPSFADQLSEERVHGLVRLIRRQQHSPPADRKSEKRDSNLQPDASDFDKRFHDLTKELKALQKQFDEAANDRSKSKTPMRKPRVSWSPRAPLG